ncbi:MAG: flagellar hook-length control protein FliK [Thermoanaerobacteraceae bacterium]|nr:flagellar hook-length control protein FliK [Thermoanaerobacteraceae bacterium]
MAGKGTGGNLPAGSSAGDDQSTSVDQTGQAAALLGAIAALTGIPAGDIQLLLTGQSGGSDAESGTGTGIPAGLPAGTARQAAELLYALLFNGQGDPAGVTISRAAGLSGLFPAGVPENATGTAVQAGPGLPGLQDPDRQQLRALLLQLLQPVINGRGSAGPVLPAGSGLQQAGEPVFMATAPGSVPGGDGAPTAAVLNQAGDLSPEQISAASATGEGTAAALDRLRTLLLQALTGAGQDGSGGPPRPEKGAVLNTAAPLNPAGPPAQGGAGPREATAALSTGPENAPAPGAAGGLFARQALPDAFPAPAGRNQASTATAGQPGHLLAEPGSVQPANHPPVPAGAGIAPPFNQPGPADQQGGVPVAQLPVQVAAVLQRAVARQNQGRTYLWFQLDPPELGHVAVRLIYLQGDVIARFQVSNAPAKEAIESALPQLRDTLAGQNLHLQNASVSVGHEGGQPPGGYYRQEGSGSGQYGSYHYITLQEEAAPAVEAGGQPAQRGINLFV